MNAAPKRSRLVDARDELLRDWTPMTNVDKRVVIADDESIIRLDLKEILEGDGYLVVAKRPAATTRWR